MAKSNKATIRNRVSEVQQLLTLSASHEEIVQYAKKQGWGVGDRTLRRYQNKAYERFAQELDKDAKKALGRQLAQIRMVIARAVKDKKYGLVLNGIELDFKIRSKLAGGQRKSIYDGAFSWNTSPNPIPRLERVELLLGALRRGDQRELQIFDNGMTRRCYIVPDTLMVAGYLHVLTLIYMLEQSERMGLYMYAQSQMVSYGDRDGSLSTLVQTSKYMFCIGFAGWEQFTQSIKLDSDQLISANYDWILPALGVEETCGCTDEPNELEATLIQSGQSAVRLPTVDEMAQGWQSLLDKIDCS